MVLEQTLKQLGLSDKEARVYLAILELGMDKVQTIARKAGVNRPTTYVILENLAKIGLVSQSPESKKFLFSAEPPSRLKILIKQKEAELEEKTKTLEQYIPHLEALFNLSENKPSVKYYEGKEGLKALQEYLISLPDKKEFWSFTPLDEVIAAFPDFEKDIVEPREKQEYPTTIIYTNKIGRSEEFEKSRPLRKVRYLPYEKFPFTVSVVTSQETVQILKFTGGFAGILIENKEVAKTFKAIFDLSWEAAEKYNRI